MNSEENFSKEKFYNNKKNDKDNLSFNSKNANKLKINYKNVCNTNRTNHSNVESENTFFNMRITPKSQNKNINNKKTGNNSMRDISNNSKNKMNNKNTSKGKNFKNYKVFKTINSKSKEKISKYIPLNKNLKKQNSNIDIFTNDSSSINQSKLEKDSYFKDNNYYTSRTPTKHLGKIIFVKIYFYFKFYLKLFLIFLMKLRTDLIITLI